MRRRWSVTPQDVLWENISHRQIPLPIRRRVAEAFPGPLAVTPVVHGGRRLDAGTAVRLDRQAAVPELLHLRWIAHPLDGDTVHFHQLPAGTLGVLGNGRLSLQDVAAVWADRAWCAPSSEALRAALERRLAWDGRRLG